MTQEELWRVIDEVTDLNESYRDSLAKLQKLAPGYSLLFAFNYVDAGIANAGVSGFHSSSAWPLVLTAVSASERARANEVALVLREMVLHYDRKGRSKLKRDMPSDFLSGLENVPDRSIGEIEDSYYALESERQAVWTVLLADDALWSPA